MIIFFSFIQQEFTNAQTPTCHKQKNIPEKHISQMTAGRSWETKTFVLSCSPTLSFSEWVILTEKTTQTQVSLNSSPTHTFTLKPRPLQAFSPHNPLITLAFSLAAGGFCWVELFLGNNTKSYRMCTSPYRLLLHTQTDRAGVQALFWLQFDWETPLTVEGVSSLSLRR